MQEWTKRAYLIACSILVLDERKYFFKYASTFLTSGSYMEEALIKWAMTQRPATGADSPGVALLLPFPFKNSAPKTEKGG